MDELQIAILVGVFFLPILYKIIKNEGLSKEMKEKVFIIVFLIGIISVCGTAWYLYQKKVERDNSIRRTFYRSLI